MICLLWELLDIDLAPEFQSPHLQVQAEAVDESFSILMIVELLIHREGSDIRVIQGVWRLRAGDSAIALVKLEAHSPGNGLLGFVDECVKGFSKR